MGFDKEKRIHQRISTDLGSIIQVRGKDGTDWKESTIVTSISRAGAGFDLSRECVIGRLVAMALPMPAELRAYDHDEELYSVYGIVQHCTPVRIDGVDRFHIGVGFVGKEMPESYAANPEQNYRITGSLPDGLWTIAEIEKEFVRRRETRFASEFNVSLALLKPERRKVERETTVSRNVSASGLGVASDLEAVVGDRVKVTCKSVDFYSMAIVRNRSFPPNGKPTLHLQFVDKTFPLEKLLLKSEKPAPDKRPEAQTGIELFDPTYQFQDVEVAD